MTRKSIFIIMLIIASGFAIFSAGQMLMILPSPEIMFGASVLSIILLSMGFFLGRGKRKNDGERDIDN